MTRAEDYKNAVEIARNGLISENPKKIASMCGATFNEKSPNNVTLEIIFLNRDIVIRWPQLKAFHPDSQKELPIQEQILLLHYMKGCLNGAEITGQWISYQDIPDGRFYMDAFIRRSKLPMIKTFGEKPELLVELAKRLYNASPFDKGDFAVIFRPLPYIPVVLLMWKGDEEFPPEGNILFDKGIYKILSAEDIAWLSAMVVYPLIGKAKEMKK